MFSVRLFDVDVLCQAWCFFGVVFSASGLFGATLEMCLFSFYVLDNLYVYRSMTEKSYGTVSASFLFVLYNT